MSSSDIEKKIARYLLQSNAIKLSPAKPFTWASGWKSPIYCDNRITLSYPAIRSDIRDEFCNVITSKLEMPDYIAGVATGAIAQGALVADKLGLPFVYVRSSPKSHGMENLIEGKIEVRSKVIVIEDLISTGGSSLKAIRALQQANCEVVAMLAIFTYGFEASREKFEKENIPVITLGNYQSLIEEAYQAGKVNASDLELLKSWRENPGKWNN